MRSMTRKLTAATFATALAFAGVACDGDDDGDVGDEVEEGVDDVGNEIEEGVDGE